MTFTATVTAVTPGTGTPTGTVTFKDGTTTLGTGTLDASGEATFTTSALARRQPSITAVYSGDTNFTSQHLGAADPDGQPGARRRRLTSSANPSVFGQSVTFTATVTP